MDRRRPKREAAGCTRVPPEPTWSALASRCGAACHSGTGLEARAPLFPVTVLVDVASPIQLAVGVAWLVHHEVVVLLSDLVTAQEDHGLSMLGSHEAGVTGAFHGTAGQLV